MPIANALFCWRIQPAVIPGASADRDSFACHGAFPQWGILPAGTKKFPPRGFAGRRMWATIMRNRFGAKEERSWKLRFHAQTAGCSLTWQQPQNNIVRTAVQAMAGVMGGCQSLHTNSLDEAYALPSEQAVTLALRTQQVLAYESGIAEYPDPFGGSYFLERLTDQMEAGAAEYIAKIDRLGGMIPAIEKGYPQGEIGQASYQFQRDVESGDATIVGVNRFAETGERAPELLLIGHEAERRQGQRLRDLRTRRNTSEVTRALADLKAVAQSDLNTMPALLVAVKTYATVGEICATLGEVFGSYTETAVL